MSEVSVHFCETEIVFAVDGEVAGRLLNSNCHPEGLAEFKRTNYDLQGSVGYQSFLRGTVAGLVLAFGPYGHRPDAEESTAKELQTIDPSEVGTVEGVLLDPGPLPTDPPERFIAPEPATVEPETVEEPRAVIETDPPIAIPPAAEAPAAS